MVFTLQHAATHYNILHTAAHSSTWQQIVPRSNTLQQTAATHCNRQLHGANIRVIAARLEARLKVFTMKHNATPYSTLQHTTTHCKTLSHTATHWNTLPHTATHCYLLQQTATHCNTLQNSALGLQRLVGRCVADVLQMCCRCVADVLQMCCSAQQCCSLYNAFIGGAIYE